MLCAYQWLELEVLKLLANELKGSYGLMCDCETIETENAEDSRKGLVGQRLSELDKGCVL